MVCPAFAFVCVSGAPVVVWVVVGRVAGWLGGWGVRRARGRVWWAPRYRSQFRARIGGRRGLAMPEWDEMLK